MAAAPNMNGATSVNGHRADTDAPTAATATLTPPAGPDRVAEAAANLMNATVDEGRKWIAGRDRRHPPLSHTSMRAWLIRSTFLLFAAVLMVALVLLGLGLMSAGEVAVILMPITTLAAVLFGVYFGGEAD